MRTISRRLLAVVFAGALIVSACGDDDDDAASTPETTEAPAEMNGSDDEMAETADIVDTAIAAGDFTTLVAAVEAAGLVDTLKGEGPFTVFAPTDAAFAALPEGALDDLLADPEALAAVLTYHVRTWRRWAAVRRERRRPRLRLHRRGTAELLRLRHRLLPRDRAAVLGDPEAVEFRRSPPSSASPRCSPARSTSDPQHHLDGHPRRQRGRAFVTTTFYDGQGMMVRAGEFESIDDMDDTHLRAVRHDHRAQPGLRFNAGGIAYEPRALRGQRDAAAGLHRGRCDGWTSDKSQLAGVRSAYPEAEGGPEA
jgi:hypothetical protein